MILDSGVFPYIDGRCFDDDYSLRLLATNDLADCQHIDRITLLEQLVAGKRIVHVGCVDHSATMVERESTRGTWLHGKLLLVAEQCLGIDINEDGINYLRNKLHIRDVYCCDLTHEDLPIAHDRPFDFLLLGEVLEHVDNPVNFLNHLRMKHFPGKVERMIVTVPNALRERNYRTSIRDSEVINSDHRYWFTPFTIIKVLGRAGFMAENIYMVRHKPLKNKRTWGVKSWHRQRLLNRHPFLRDTIVVTASPLK